MAKVRVTQVPQVKTKVRIAGVPNAAGAPFFNQAVPSYLPNELSTPDFKAGRTLQEVPRDEANIEAEKGETALVPNKGGLPAHYNIEGKRHVNGGTPLNVPKDTFIYSDTKKMRIKDPNILAEFGKAKGSYTPADLAKKYDINKYRKILQDPDSDPIMVSTAEKMIGNYNLKLGKLALVQESKKGFPQGIPAAAMPYMSTYNIGPDQVLPLKAEDQMTQDIPHEEISSSRYGGSYMYGGGYQAGGSYADLDAQLQAIIEKNKQAQADALKRLQEEKDQNLRSYAQNEFESTRKGLERLKSQTQELLAKAPSQKGVLQERLLFQISQNINQLKQGTESLPYVSNPKNYAPGQGVHGLRTYNFKPTAPTIKPPAVPAKWMQNPDKSWTQGFMPEVLPAMPATMSQDTINPYNMAQQAMMNFPGASPYMDTTHVTSPVAPVDTTTKKWNWE